MRTSSLVMPVIFSFLAACSSLQTAERPLPKEYVCLGLFRNENTFPITITLDQNGGVYTDMPVEPRSINRTAIRPKTIALVTSRSGKPLYTSPLVTVAAMKNYDSEKHTIYY